MRDKIRHYVAGAIMGVYGRVQATEQIESLFEEYHNSIQKENSELKARVEELESNLEVSMAETKAQNGIYNMKASELQTLRDKISVEKIREILRKINKEYDCRQWGVYIKRGSLIKDISKAIVDYLKD
jgi:Skp family chaperone for outer membrane proteins